MLCFLLLAGLSSGWTAIVTEPVTNLFSKPSTDADVVSQAIYSTNLKVVEAHDDWVRIQTPDSYTGWVRKAAIVAGSPYAVKGRVAEVESLFANVYRETDLTVHQPLVTVPFETRFEVVAGPRGENDRWYQVRLPDDRQGWVQNGDIRFSQAPYTVAETIAFSRRFLGLTYTWGGVSTFGYDCSGFTQMLFRRMGIALPRDTGPQANWTGMRPVERAELKPGDLLYFGDTPPKISHTGLYIGNGEFINATAYLKPMVQICRLDDEHWSRRFIAARRLKEEGTK